MRNVDQLIDELIAIRDAYSGDLPVVYAADMEPDYDSISASITNVDCYNDIGKSITQGDDVEPTHVFLL